MIDFAIDKQVLVGGLIFVAFLALLAVLIIKDRKKAKAQAEKEEQERLAKLADFQAHYEPDGLGGIKEK